MATTVAKNIAFQKKEGRKQQKDETALRSFRRVTSSLDVPS